MNRLAEWTMLAYGWRRFALLVGAGALAGLSAAPIFIVPALFVALPFWVWSLDGAERRRGFGRVLGPAFWIGCAFGLGYFTVALHWVGAAFLQEGSYFIALMPLAVGALAALMALFWGVGSALAHLLWSPGPARIVTFATAISAAEYARGTWFTGLPFDLLGYALTPTPEMAQVTAYIGVYGLTFLALLAAATPALAWPADSRNLAARLVAPALALVALAGQYGFGAHRLATNPIAMRENFDLRLVQPVIREHTDWRAADPATIVLRLIELSGNPAGKRLLVWPESVFPFYLSTYPEALARIARLLPPETLLVTGAPREAATGTGPAHNALLAINGDGEVVASYDKAHLVPFGEYLPFPDFWRRFGVAQFVPGHEGWAAGDGRRLVRAPGTLNFIALICYEALFTGDLGAKPADAEIIINISNDAWFDGSIGPGQHAHHARIRAVETGLPLVRATNSGVTFVADPLGRVVGELPPAIAGVLDTPLPQKLADTLFNRLGHLPFFVVLALGLGVGLTARRRAR